MSDFSKLLKKATGIPEQHIDSLKSLGNVVSSLPAEARNMAADVALNASGIDITQLLDRLTPNQKVKVMAWAMRQGQKP